VATQSLTRLARKSATLLTCGALAVAATAMFVLAVAPSAVADQPKQAFATGLTRAAGTIVDPAGQVWVSDGLAGFCRIQPPGLNPGRIDNPLTSTDPTLPTCLGGTLPLHGAGPTAPGTPAFYDPTPGQPGSGDELVFIPDSTPGSSDVVRAKWRPDTKTFGYWDTLQIFDGDLRPNAATAGPDNAVYLSFARTRVIVRLTYPDFQHPSVDTVASASGAVKGLAAAPGSGGNTTVYVAEASGITKFTAPPPGTLTNITPTAAYSVPKANSLLYDSATNTMYAGSASGTTSADVGKDTVTKINLATGAVDSQWALGYSMVTGFGMLSAKLLVMDDAGLIASGTPSGMGIMYLLSGAVVQIVSGPTGTDGKPAPNPAYTNNPKPQFTVSSNPSGAIKCAITQGTTSPAWVDCSSGTFTQPTSLADGAYTFQVTSTSGGTVASKNFTVDTIAPAAPTITSPTNQQVVNGSPILGATTEANATLQCAINSSADSNFTACTPGDALRFLTEGQQSLYVRAVDQANNVGPASSVVVTVDLTAPQLTITAPTEGSTVTVVSDHVDVTFTSSSTDVDHFNCRLDSAAFTPCTSPKTFTGISAGQHRTEIQAVDRAGNVTTTGVNFTVQIQDTTPPTITATPAGTYGPSQTIVLSADEAATIYYTTDGSTPTTSSPLYSGPIAMATMTLTYFGVDTAQNASAVASQSYVLDNTAPTVSASPGPGAYAAGQPVTLTSSEAGVINFTTDGSTPTRSSTTYTGPMALNASTTFKAIATDNYGNTSAPASFAYTVKDTTPPVITASPLGGQYASGTQIILSSNEANTTIYYSTDGRTPTTSSTKYTAALTLTAAMTLEYFGVDGAGNVSAVASQAYAVASAIVPWKDFTKDGNNDVFAYDSGGNGWVYPGNGTGGWLNRIASGIGWTSLTLVTATRDLDGDGISDVVARDTSGALWLYPGDGLGKWKPRVQLGTGLGSMNLIVAPGDWNGDGKSDLLIRDTAGNLWLYPGNGVGGLGARTQVGWGWGIMDAIVSTGDFNGDGKSDLLARDTSGNLYLYPGTGTGGFGSRTQVGWGWTGYTIVGIGDFNGDKKNDLLAEDSNGSLFLYPGTGSGGFGTRSQVGSGWIGFTIP
jgi:Chitobiase/beta-hexosaminidase C-terminal domain/FG-GAP-like repeat